MKSACAQQVQSLSSGKELLPEPCAACAARVLSVCDAIDDCDLDRLAAITSVQDIARHQIFVTEGDPADHLFNVTDGTVKVYKLLPDGRQQITGFLFAGDFLGLSFLERYGCSAEAAMLPIPPQAVRCHADGLSGHRAAASRDSIQRTCGRTGPYGAARPQDRARTGLHIPPHAIPPRRAVRRNH